MKTILTRISAGLALFLAPALAFAQSPVQPAAQSAAMNNPLAKFLQTIIGFIDGVLVPFLFAIALMVFIWGVFQYFIAGGADEEKRDKGKKLVVWGLAGFVVMVALWGIVNLLTNTLSTFGIDNNARPCLPSFTQKTGNCL